MFVFGALFGSDGTVSVFVLELFCMLEPSFGSPRICGVTPWGLLVSVGECLNLRVSPLSLVIVSNQQ